MRTTTLAFVIGYVLGDHLYLKRSFRRLERFVLLGSMQSWKPTRNTKPQTWQNKPFSTDMSFETVYQRGYEI